MAVPRVVVGFDIGTSFGWAVLVAGERVGSGTHVLPSGKGHFCDRWVAARDHIEWVLDSALVHADGFTDDIFVGFERVEWLSGPNWQAVYYAMKAFIEEQSHRKGVRSGSLVPTQWKKTAVGHGNASKAAYIAAASERYGLKLRLEDEDQAAALGVAYAALVDLGGPVRLVTGQQERNP